MVQSCCMSHKNSLPVRGCLLGSLNLPDSLDAALALAALPQHVAHASQPVTARNLWSNSAQGPEPAALRDRCDTRSKQLSRVSTAKMPIRHSSCQQPLQCFRVLFAPGAHVTGIPPPRLLALNRLVTVMLQLSKAA